MISRLTHLLLVLVLALPAFAQTGILKNVQFLKGASRDQIVWTMGFISQSLGVTCDECHVRGAKGFEFDRDDKEEKRTARRMMAMTKVINDQNFEGRQQVTCATCHQGQLKTESSNPVVSLETLAARAAAKRQAAAALPPAADLLANYDQAIGGAAAVAKLATRRAEFTAVDPTGKGSGETLQKAPDKFVETTSFPNRTARWVFDGASAHITTPEGTQPVTGLDLEYVRFGADFRRTLDLSNRYTAAKTIGRDTIDGQPVYIVEGQVKGSDVKERLFFAANSGLLLRRQTYRPTLLGFVADETDFSDYRTVDGVKVPFVVNAATGAFATTRTYTSIQFNVPIDDSAFSGQ